MNNQILHFTMGPVQSFVAEARRTRDLWAGSFLLSWLAGQAMVELSRNQGQIIFPEATKDELFGKIIKGHEVETTPYIGSLPNRFKADISKLSNPENAGELCRNIIQKKWHKLADAVWQQFVAPVSYLGVDTKAIWDRQVEYFWEIYWVQGEDPGDKTDGSWLDLRKNWRSHYHGSDYAEGGDHCLLMGDFQEISGYCRVRDREKQQAFWKALREQRYEHISGQKRKLGALNFEENEYLCAIALIKRLFPLLNNIEDIIGWRPGSENFNIINWPSVSYIAALPWLQVAQNKTESVLDDYADLIKKHENTQHGIFGETDTKLFNFSDDSRFFKLDGQLFHLDAIENWPLDDFKGTLKESKERRKEIYKSLEKICKEFHERRSVKASEFYAVLLMDGDKIGKLLSDNPDLVKAGLASFTDKVKRHFQEENTHNGALVYAGGDDVLALLPIDTALDAAKFIRGEYRAAFNENISEDGPPVNLNEITMSAAIVCAQYKIPLSAVLKQSHYYLDDIAKDKNGRDSVAIAVMKPGGVAYDWVSCWEGERSPVNDMQTLYKQLQIDPEFSSSFFYNVKSRYLPLFDVNSGHENNTENIPEEFADADFIEKILHAECAKGKQVDGESKFQIDLSTVMSIGLPLNRNKQMQINSGKSYDFDSGLVARFFATEGKWYISSEGNQ